jgi:uncharacterized membrane protein (DUF2068 family)
MHQPPGTEEIQRFRPKLRYELIGCALHGHELIGTFARHIRPTDSIVVREYNGLRWHRCLRCDSWLPLAKTAKPTEDHIPNLSTIEVPLRGKPLRDRYVLRLIAVDRAIHVLILGLLGLTIILFAEHRSGLYADYIQVLNSLQGANGGISQGREVLKLQKVFQPSVPHIYELGFLVLGYAVLEAVEMVGLWFAKRWAEYLTFVATISFIPYEVYEFIHKPSALKITAFIINVAIAAYLLYAKRLFGVRGGGAAERRERQRDTGWEAVRRVTP